ncbi:hypothetical protein FRB91_000812 [Serendipita sp. 411]|nr:hypothetical protein FRB91_000812 [Serendipita sp. 411]
MSVGHIPALDILASPEFDMEEPLPVIVHRKMAKVGYAPTLHGMAKVKGAPTAYIMGYLSPEQG